MVVSGVMNEAWGRGVHAARSRQARKLDVPNVSGAFLEPQQSQAGSSVLAFGRCCQKLCPAELGLRLPKAVEQDGEFARYGDAGALWSLCLGEPLAPCLERVGSLDPREQVVGCLIKG